MKTINKVLSVTAILLTMSYFVPVRAGGSTPLPNIALGILGVWNCQQNIYADPSHPTTPSDVDYFIEIFHPDGTDVFTNTALNSQNVTFSAGPNNGAVGFDGTAVLGRWIPTASNNVQRIASFLVGVKSNTIPGVPPFIASIPTYRALVKCNCNLTDLNSMKVSGTFSFYDKGDLDYSQGALATVPFNATCKRLLFNAGN